MTHRLLLVALLQAGLADSPVESKLHEYEIRPAYQQGPSEVARRYRRNLKRGGTSYHAADTLAGFLAQALKTDRLRIFGPPWIHNVRYEVYFRTKEETSALSPVLLNLLSEKFKLKYRKGPATVDTFVLTTPGGEPGLPPSRSKRCVRGPAPAEPAALDAGIRGAHEGTDPDSPAGVSVPDGTVVFYRGCLMADVKEALERRLGRPVIDETTTKGRYDFDLHLRQGPRSAEHTFEPLAAQLKHKLGAELRLAPRPLDMAVVIDSATEIGEPLRFRADLTN
jgi:uncharacterized protein (TIGR03435 family)